MVKSQPEKVLSADKQPEVERQLQSKTKKISSLRKQLETKTQQLKQRKESGQESAQNNSTPEESQSQTNIPTKQLLTYKTSETVLTIPTQIDKNEIEVRLPGKGPVTWNELLAVTTHFSQLTMTFEPSITDSAKRELLQSLKEEVSAEKYQKLFQTNEYSEELNQYMSNWAITKIGRDMRRYFDFRQNSVREIFRWFGRRIHKITSSKKLDRFAEDKMSSFIPDNLGGIFESPDNSLWQLHTSDFRTGTTKLWITDSDDNKHLVFGPSGHRVNMTPEEFQAFISSIEGGRLVIEYRPSGNMGASEEGIPEWIKDEAFEKERLKTWRLAQ